MNIYEKVYLIGSGRVACECSKILYEYRKDITFLNIEKDKFGSSKKFCERTGISYFDIQKKDVKDFLKEIKVPTLIISAHNSYLFPKEIVKKDNLKIINMHIALLPKYRGMNAPTWEIYEQQEYAGTTWHLVSEEIDAGAIIVQKKFRIDRHDSAMTVLRKSFDLGIEMLKENAEVFLLNRYEVGVYFEKTRLYLSKDKPNDGYMESSWDIEKKYAFLRAMDYSGTNIMPFPRVKLDGDVYEIRKYSFTEIDEADEKSEMRNTGNCIEWIEGNKCLICRLKPVSI